MVELGAQQIVEPGDRLSIMHAGQECPPQVIYTA